MTLPWQTRVILHLSEPIEYTAPASAVYDNCGLRMTTGECRLMATPGGNAVNGSVMGVDGGAWESLILAVCSSLLP